jgi:hypothetical protein
LPGLLSKLPQEAQQGLLKNCKRVTLASLSFGLIDSTILRSKQMYVRGLRYAESAACKNSDIGTQATLFANFHGKGVTCKSTSASSTSALKSASPVTHSAF